MGCTLDNEQFSSDARCRGVLSGKLVDEPVFVVDSAAPIACPVAKRLRFADAGVSVALNVFYEQIDSLQCLFVLELPARILIPCARRECKVHCIVPSQSSISSWRCPSPRSMDSIDSRSTRWFVSDQNGSGDSVTTSKGSFRRITNWRRKRRTALDMSSPALSKRVSAAFRRRLSTLICSVVVAILKSFVVQNDYIVARTHLNVNGEERREMGLRVKVSLPHWRVPRRWRGRRCGRSLRSCRASCPCRFP